MAAFSEIALRILLSAKDDSAPGLARARDGIKSVATQLQSLETVARRFLDIHIFVTFVREVQQTIDKATTLDARIKLVTKSTQEYTTASRELFRVAQDARVSLEATSGLYIKVDRAVRQLNGTQQQAIDITETVAKAIGMTSDGIAQDAAAILQFGQALGSATLQGDELRGILENSAGLAQVLADGMGVPVAKLKELGSAGEITGAKMVEALQKQKAVVDQQFASMPVTVSQAITRIQNSWLHYISTSDAARGATSALTRTLGFVSEHFTDIADAAGTLAMIYVSRLAVGAARVTGNWIANAQAARAAAAATLEKQRAAVAEAAAQVAETKATVAHTEALLVDLKAQQASAAATQMRWRLTAALDAQLKSVTAAEAALAAAQAKVGTGVDNLRTSLTSLNGIVNVLSAAWIGWEIGAWLNRFELVRQAGNHLAETLHIIATVAGHVFSGDLFRGSESLKAKIDTLRLGYEDLRRGTTDAALAQEEASRRSAEATEASQQLAQEAWKKTQEKLKETTAVLESEYQRQNAAVDLALKAREDRILASGQSESVREQQGTLAVQEALKQKLTNLGTYAQQRMTLLDGVYQAELAKDNQGVMARKAIEGQYLMDKRAAYVELANGYAGMVDSIIAQHSRELQAAGQVNEQIKQLSLTAEQQILELQRGAMSEREVLRSKEKESASKLAQLKAEATKGESADQSKINRLHQDLVGLIMERTKGEQNAARTSVEKSSAASKGIRELNEVNGIYHKSLEREKGLHEKNANALLPSLTQANNSLADINGKIKTLDDQLAKDKLLKFAVDQGSLSDARKVIAELTAPAEKVITIRTVNAGATEAKAAGGPVGLALGGFPRRSGRLGGYGGGDRVRALLEAGEFVIRKEAVAQYGEGLFAALNARAVNVARMALGGFVFQSRKREEKPVDFRDLEQSIGQWQQALTGAKWFAQIPDDKLREASMGLLDARRLARTDDDKRKLEKLQAKLDEISEASRLAGDWLFRNGPQFQEGKTGGYGEHILLNKIYYAYQDSVRRLGMMSAGGLVRMADGGPVAQAAAAAASRVAVRDTAPMATTPAPGRTIRIQFAGPDGSSAVGGFDERMADQFLGILRSAGARVL